MKKLLKVLLIVTFISIFGMGCASSGGVYHSNDPWFNGYGLKLPPQPQPFPIVQF